MQPGDTVAVVASGARFLPNMLATIDSGSSVEIVSICAVSGNILSIGVSSCPNIDGRGFDGTTAVAHSIGKPVAVYATAWHINSLRKEVEAIETALGANLSAVAAQQNWYNSNAYNFSAQPSGGVSLNPGNNSITMTPVPLGVNGTDGTSCASTNHCHGLYVSGGVGAAEACQITGGSGTSGQASGTIIINCANSHTGAWTIRSATAGISEAVSFTPNGGTIFIPAGSWTAYATIFHGPYHSFVGAGRTAVTTGGTFISAGAGFAGPIFEYLSPAVATDINVGIGYAEMGITAKNGIQINATGAGTQNNVKNVIFRHLFLNGTYYSQSDPNIYSASVAPTLAAITAFGVGISCNMCFDSWFDNLEVENFGIGTYIQADQNVIGAGSRYALNGVHVWLDGATVQSNRNVIMGAEFLNNYRLGAITQTSALGTIIESNYLENYCLSSQFVRSTNSIGLIFAKNHMEDPDNGPGCALQNGGSNYGGAGTNVTPLLYLDDYHSDDLAENTMDLGPGIVPPIAWKNTNWSWLSYTNQYFCEPNNGVFFPCPTGQYNKSEGATAFYPQAPAVLIAPVNPLLFRHNNHPTTILGGASPAIAPYFPHTWIQSGTLKQPDNTTGRWVLATGTDYEPTFQIATNAYPVYALNVTARKNGTGVAVTAAKYTDAAGNVTTYTVSTALTFVATTESETRSQLLTIGTAGPGKFMLTLDGSQAEIEQVELVPVPFGSQLPSYVFAALPAQGNGQSVYCSDCKNVVDNAATAGIGCVSGGAGAIAKRQNGRWDCN
jgi:hypothetical protein